MHTKLRELLGNLIETITPPTNPDLPFMVLWNLQSEYDRIYSCIKTTLEKGKLDNGVTLLNYAIEKNNELLIQCLQKEGLSCTLKDIEQHLIKAIETKNLKQFTHLIEFVRSEEDFNSQLATLGFGSTLLLYCLMFGNSEMSKILIDKGADLSVRDWQGTSALSCAIASNNIDCFHHIPILNKEELFIENLYGFSPLHLAVRNESKILDELCQQFAFDKAKIIQDYQNYPKQRIEQELIVEKLSKYIHQQNSKHSSSQETQEDSKNIAEKIRHGLCHGLSFLFGLHAAITLREMNEFYHTLAQITSWDDSEEMLSTPIKVTYRGQSFNTRDELMKQFTNDVFYFFAQEGLSSIDIAPHDRTTQYQFLNSGPIKITPILDISMHQMRKEELVDILRNTLKPNTLLDVTGAFHTISIVCNSLGDIYFYDSNNFYPTRQPIVNLENFTTLILNTMPIAYSFQNQVPHYIGVYHLSDKENKHAKSQYPSQEEIVNKYILNSERKNNLYQELELCVLQDSAKQFECLLNSNQLPALSLPQIIDLVDTALQKNSFQCLAKLIKFGNLEKDQLDLLEKNTTLTNYREILTMIDKQSSQPTYQATFF